MIFFINANLLNDLSPEQLVTIMLRYVLRATLTLGKVSASPSSCSKIACWDGVTHDPSLAKAANWIISSANTLLSLKSLRKALASFSTSVFYLSIR